jgi:hypothetical protein
MDRQLSEFIEVATFAEVLGQAMRNERLGPIHPA